MKNRFTNWTQRVMVLKMDMRWTLNEDVLYFVAFEENFPNGNEGKKIWMISILINHVVINESTKHTKHRMRWMNECIVVKLTTSINNNNKYFKSSKMVHVYDVNPILDTLWAVELAALAYGKLIILETCLVCWRVKSHFGYTTKYGTGKSAGDSS